MAKILHLALNTWREAVRDRVLLVIVLFAVLMMCASSALGWVSQGDQSQIVTHFSLGVTSFFGALVAIFVGSHLIHKEIEKRTLYSVLSKPVERWQFLLGKFLGLLAVEACVVGGMGAIACFFIARAGAPVSGLVLLALLLIFFEMMIVTSLAILFGTLSSPVLAALFTLCAYLVGQVTPSLLDLTNFRAPAASELDKIDEGLTPAVARTQWLIKPASAVLYRTLPNLTHFQLRNRVVYGPPVKRGTGPWGLGGEIDTAILYALCYSCAVLCLAALAFQRRRF